MKKFLIYLIVLFSAFLGSGSVNAENLQCTDYYNCNEDAINKFISTQIAKIPEYKYFIFQTRPKNYNFNDYIQISFFKSYDGFIIGDGSTTYDTTYKYLKPYEVFYQTKTNLKFSELPEDYNLSLYKLTSSTSVNFPYGTIDIWSTRIIQGLIDGWGDESITYTNIPTLKQYDNSNFTYGNVYKNNITFHLNGGKVTIPNETCDDKGCYIDDIIYYDDYTEEISSDNFKNYLLNQKVERETMHFAGWYYDEKFQKKVNIDDVITEDKHFYAKWNYKNVDDFLSNTKFVSHTFDSNYEYAIISLGNNTGDIYIGLQKMLYNLEIYEYNEILKEYLIGSTLNLVPIYSHNDLYYYRLDPARTNNLNIIVLPKNKLEEKQNGKTTTYYDFYLSENAKITYTNNLNKSIIYDSNGNRIESNLENTYKYSQDLLIKDNNLLEIFKELLENKNNNIFYNINQIWNYLKRSKVYTYLMILIVGSLIILIIKAASRK